MKKEKYDLKRNKIKYPGQIIDTNSRWPYPLRTCGIKDMPTENVIFQQSFLSLATYYNVIVPNKHCLVSFLKQTIQKDSNLSPFLFRVDFTLISFFSPILSSFVPSIIISLFHYDIYSNKGIHTEPDCTINTFVVYIFYALYSLFS